MAELNKPSQNIQTTQTKFKVKDVLRDIAMNHIQNKYGEITFDGKGRKELWKFGGKIVKPYFYTDLSSIPFITALSKPSVEYMINQHAFLLAIQYYGGDRNGFKIYFIRPEVVLDHYINPKIKQKKGTEAWHVRVKYENNNLIFIRGGDAPDIFIPVDDDNYCVRFEMTEGEYERLNAVLGHRKNQPVESKKTLKVIVEGQRGLEISSITSALAIALLSVLTKSTKPLTIEEIVEEIIKYGVLSRGVNETGSINNIITKLRKISAIEVIKNNGQIKSYKIANNVSVKVDL